MQTSADRNVVRTGVRRPVVETPEPHPWTNGERCTHDGHGLGTVVRVESSSVIVDFGEGANAVRRVKLRDSRLKPL